MIASYESDGRRTFESLSSRFLEKFDGLPEKEHVG